MQAFDLAREVPRLGHRAELVASWYLRFNGYSPLTAFILHDAGATKQPGGQLTDADILAVRLPHTEEIIESEHEPIRVQTDPQLDVQHGLTDFIIAEASSQECKFNWLNDADQTVNVKHLGYCLRRFGYWDPQTADWVATQLSEKRFFLSGSTIPIRVRLLSFGVRQSPNLSGIQQITFKSIFEYMKGPLFGCYEHNKGVKERIVSDHKQWHPLICEIYKRLMGHKMQENSPWEVVTWLYPDAETVSK